MRHQSAVRVDPLFHIAQVTAIDDAVQPLTRGDLLGRPGPDHGVGDHLQLHPRDLAHVQFGPDEAKVIAADLRAVALELMRSPEKLVETLRKHPKLLEAYTSCGAETENDGHRFGEDLPEADKQALIAFLATL